MRRLRSPLATLTTLAAVTAIVLAGCSEDPDPGGATSLSPSSGETTPGEQTAGAEETPDAPKNTYDAVEEPAPVALDADLVDGIEAISVWEEAEPLNEQDEVGGEVSLGAGRSLVLYARTIPAPLAAGSSGAALRDWRRNNGITVGPTEVLDPVVVDGVEMLRARGENPANVVDVFILGTEGLTIEVLFGTPIDFSEAEREEAIGQVMATVELDERS